MRITALGHACVLIESDATRILVDPGTYTPGFEEERGVEAVFVTHQHGDHMAIDRIPRLMAFNPQATLYAETEASAQLAAAGLECQALAVDATVEVGDLSVTAVGGRHAIIHEDLGCIGNIGLVVEHDDIRFFHPGDSYEITPEGVDVLAVPLMAPWATLGETVDFLRAVQAPRWIPIHDALLSPAGRAGYLGNLTRMGPEQSTLVDPTVGASVDV